MSSLSYTECVYIQLVGRLIFSITHVEALTDTTFLPRTKACTFTSMKPWYPAPTSSKILLHCRSPQLPAFEMSCAVPSLTATAGTTNILLLLPEQGRSKQFLSQGREEKQQEGQLTRPYSKCLQCFSVVVTYARSASGNPNLMISKSLLLSCPLPSFLPFSRLWMDTMWGSVLGNTFSICCRACTAPLKLQNWSMPLPGQLRLQLREPERSSRTRPSSASTARCNRN